MVAWLDTFTGVLGIATGADMGQFGIGGESLIGFRYRSRLTAGRLFTFSIGHHHPYF